MGWIVESWEDPAMTRVWSEREGAFVLLGGDYEEWRAA
jgi:hypothetical protein